jgi:hypothetical protein
MRHRDKRILAMRKTRLILVNSVLTAFVVTLLFGCGVNTQKQELVQQKIDSVKSIFAPDKRIALYDLSAMSESGKWLIKGETNLKEAKQALIEALTGAGILFSDKITVLPDSTVKKPWGIINLSVANIRYKPGHSQELVSQALLGTPVKIIKTKGYWNLVQTPDNYMGWLDGTAVFEMNKDEFNLWQKSDHLIYTAHAGFVWSKETMQKPVSDITAGSILRLDKETKTGYYVTFPDNRAGFIAKNEANPFGDWMNSHSYSQEKILETAMPFLGHPYLWGGTSTKGVDCSGFTKTVYFLNGLVLQRDASQQELYGENIPTDNNFEQLQPGDLLFFGRAQTDSTTKRVTHVGIYAGNLEFIHAAGRVFYDSFNPEAENYNGFRKNSLVSVKRVLNSINTPGIEKITDNSFYKPQQ